MSKTIREQAIEAAAKVGAVTQITPADVEGINETLHVQRLSIEERTAVGDTGLPPGRRSNVAAGLTLLAKAVVLPQRVDDKLVPYMTRDEWASWAGENTELFYKLAVKVNTIQGDAKAEETAELGND